ncbi:MAG: hypothetical protein DRP65_09210 [Planctomycetota bacterium]|nr:MAG: hypothetical protein DRP65_09210 [Planctomycetota bacterium]
MVRLVEHKNGVAMARLHMIMGRIKAGKTEMAALILVVVEYIWRFLGLFVGESPITMTAPLNN